MREVRLSPQVSAAAALDGVDNQAEAAVVAVFQRKGMTVSVVNPKRTHYFTKVQSRVAKTDALDALGLVEFGERLEQKPTRPISSEPLELAELVLRRGHKVTAQK